MEWNRIIATVPPPNVILQWDPHSDTFYRISLEVHDNVHFAKAKNRFIVFCMSNVLVPLQYYITSILIIIT